MSQGTRWDVMVIGVHVTGQGIGQVLPGAEAGGGEHLGDAPVEALHPAVGLGTRGLDEAVLDGLLGTGPIEAVAARRLPLTGGAEPIGEFLAVVRQDLGDLEGDGCQEVLEEALGAGGGLLGPDLHIHPAGGPVDADEQIPVLRLVGQLGQVLDLHVHEARHVILEGLQGGLGALLPGDPGGEVRDPMAAQKRSRPKRETSGWTNSRTTASRSSRGSSRV
jgi:hypothetical protein